VASLASAGEAAFIAQAIKLLALTVAASAITASCQASAADAEAELEIGTVAERSVAGNAAAHAGPSVAIEFTPIEHWLELEAAVSRLQIDGAAEWETEVAVKKPFDLSPGVELMLGLGPTWTHSGAPLEQSDSFGAELILDLQFWRTRRWGWFIEPSYSVGFSRGSDRAVAVTAGVLLSLD
jgi:hypothetical protein